VSVSVSVSIWRGIVVFGGVFIEGHGEMSQQKDGLEGCLHRAIEERDAQKKMQDVEILSM